MIMAIRILYSFVIFSKHFDPFLFKTLSFYRILIAFYENCSKFGIFVRCGARDVGRSKVQLR